MYISPDYEKSILFDHRFWLQILGDHSRFILTTLSPKEKAKAETAESFINIFDALLNKSRENISGAALAELNAEALNQTKKLRLFKLRLLREHLVGKIASNLPPTFFNHMLNELDEYLRILSAYMSNAATEAHPLHYHLLWLKDGVGHADSIINNLDDVEKDLKKKGKEFAKHFDNLYSKSVEFAGYTRTNLDKFPALSRLNTQAELEMLMFMAFLQELEELRLNKKALGTIQPLMLDHMFREECYYLTKLSQVSDLKKPDCNPGKPRIEE